MEYINRTNDFEKVISSINNYDITYILSGKAFGLTSFMQELGKRLFQYHVFTLNTINGVNVANLLVSEIMHSDERKKFKKMAEKEEKVIFGGRLGEYKYYDMDAVIASSLELCEKELGMKAE